ncbi:MAG: ABC transporter substrate-binding protein [Lysobacteraceae bacterium]
MIRVLIDRRLARLRAPTALAAASIALAIGGLALPLSSIAQPAPMPSPTAQAAMTPSQLVQSNSQRVIRALSSRRAEFQANTVLLHDYIRSEFSHGFDRVYSARLVLGRNGTDVADAQLRGFADALAENLMQRYGNSLLQLDPGLNVKVTSEQSFRNGSIIKVKSLVDRSSGAPVPVDYLMHQADGEWKIFDVLVEGTSFVGTFRTQFNDELRRKSLAQITADLRAGAIAVDPRIRK